MIIFYFLYFTSTSAALYNGLIKQRRCFYFEGKIISND